MNGRVPPPHWYAVQTFPLSADLSALLALLRQRGLLFRVTEERAGQCLWVADAAAVEPLRQFIDTGGLDRLDPPPTAVEGRPARRQAGGLRLLRLFDQFPVTLLTIYLGVLGALLVGLDHGLDWVAWFTFQPLRVEAGHLLLQSFSSGMAEQQWWRLITPIFLHFGLFHILFNGLWVWEFGRRIEALFGSGALLLMLLVLGVVSNAVQYLWSGPAMFGGLSGVLYGLLGFLWIFHRIRPHPVLSVPAGIIGFMLFWQALCLFGVVDAFIDGSIANGAHMGGLGTGMLLGFLLARRRQR